MSYTLNVRIVFIALMLFSLLFSVSCTSTKPVTKPESEREAEKPKMDESFDPLMLDDEDIEFPEKKTPQPQPNEAIPFPETGPSAGKAEDNKKVDGFRVQLFATKDIEKATLEKKEAEFVFAENEIAVYIEFDSPMYKVRIGDSRTREEAEQIRELARKKGYTTSWIVKTKINTNPSLPQNLDTNFDDL